MGQDKYPEKTGAELIAEERLRQVDLEGYSLEHDISWNRPDQFLKAAVAYVLTAIGGRYSQTATSWWPKEWDPAMFKPKDFFRDLVRAGALIAAAIDWKIFNEKKFIKDTKESHE